MHVSRLFVVFCLFLVTSFCFAGTWYGKDTEHLAVFKDSVTDLVITLPLPKKGTMGAAPFKDPRDGACRRSHQGLFNEVVTIVQEQTDEVQVSFSNIIYGFDEQTKEPLSTFWVQRKQLLFLRELESQGADLSVFPPPQGLFSRLTLMLRFPWQKYSVGTRFVRVPAYDTETEYGVRLFDTNKHRAFITKIPRDRALIESKLDPQAGRKLFVKLANDLLDYVQALPGGTKVIPYVWGGSSCISFSEDTKMSNDGQCWVRPEVSGMYTGYDCSELVWRLASMSGVKHPYKTTLTLWEQGHVLTPDEQVEDGDLIVIPGHVMIVSNKEKNEIIHARGYQSGYGSVHRVSLENLFQGITTYDQLVDAYARHEQLGLLQRDKSLQKLYPFKIIKLCTTAAQG